MQKICRLPQQSSTATESTPTLAPTPTPLPPILGIPVPILPQPLQPSSSVLPDRPLVPGCECEEMMCIQSFPNSCHCEYGIKKNCYNKCGGPSPGLNTCPPLGSISSPFDGPVKRNAEPEPQLPTVPIPVKAPVSVPSGPGTVGTQSTKCVCEERFCIQSFPAGCICANRNKNACWRKCGGPKPMLQVGSCLAVFSSSSTITQ